MRTRNVREQQVAEKISKRLNQKTELQPIRVYCEGSYFGDSDIFAQTNGLSSFSGRDSSSICLEDSAIFVLDLDLLKIIKQSFREIYDEMEHFGIKKHKFHCIQISSMI